MLDSALRDLLCCPRDRSSLRLSRDGLACDQGHSYACVDGVPILLLEEAEATHPAIEQSLRGSLASAGPPSGPSGMAGADAVDAYVQDQIVGTNGLLYRDARHQLHRYPIPELRLPPGGGKRLLDVGCNWGRWSIAACQQGYQVTGIDPSLQAVLAARRVAARLSVAPVYVVADARFLPFRTGAFDQVFSYSVLQHFAPAHLDAALRQIGRVLRDDGQSLVQMANAFGLRSLQHQAQRRFRTATGFEVRYWTPARLLSRFRTAIGPSRLAVDGFLSLNAQAADLDLLPARYRLVVHCSELLRKLSAVAPPLRYLADSLYVRSVKRCTVAAGSRR
jgi:SAM-dependent methyltransferase/uncharacterized protein YbaR (Trm112 family)